MSFKKRSLKKKNIMFGAGGFDMGTSSNESTCRKCGQFRFMCMCPIEIDSGVRKKENTLDSMEIYASVWKRKVNKEKGKEKNLLSLHSVVKQAQLQQKESQNVTKNYASVWKKKVDRRKSIRSKGSIRSLEVERLKNINKNQDQTQDSIEIQSFETAAEQRTDEANIVTNPVATQSVPLGMKRKLMLRLSDSIPLAGVISNRKKTISNFQKEAEKQYALKQVIFKCTINLPKTHYCKDVSVNTKLIFWVVAKGRLISKANFIVLI